MLRFPYEPSEWYLSHYFHTPIKYEKKDFNLGEWMMYIPVKLLGLLCHRVLKIKEFVVVDY